MAHALIPVGLMVAGSALSAGATILGARSESSALKDEANQLEVAAGKDRASSQRAAMEERRQGRLLASRSLAVAAASGGGASDPTVINNLANLEGESQYRAMVRLYEGEEAARGKEAEAVARRKDAKSVKTAGYLNAAGSIIGAAGSATLKGKYGGAKHGG